MSVDNLDQNKSNELWQKAEIPIVIGVSAHRNIDKRYYEDIKKQVGKFLDKIISLYSKSHSKSPVYMLTGLAQGGDMLCARVAKEKGIKLIVALPFETFTDESAEEIPYDNEQDFSDSDDLQEYRNLINSEQVIKKFVVPDIEGKKPTESIKDQRRYLFRQQAIYVSTNCHILLALWDGTPAKGEDVRLGCGTNIAVEFALKHNFYHPRGMEFFSPYIGAVAGIFSPREGKTYIRGGKSGNKIESGDFNKDDFAYKFIAKKDNSKKDNTKKPQRANNIFEDLNDTITASKKMSRHIRDVLVRTNAYNRDSLKYRKALRKKDISQRKKDKPQKAPSYLVNGQIYTSQEELKPIHDCYRIASDLSTKNKNKYLRGVKLLSAFGVLLILSWMLYDQLSYPWTVYVCAGMLGLLVLGYFVVKLSEATRLPIKIKLRAIFDVHTKFIEYRALSETLRIQYYLLALGVDENVGNLFSWGHKSEMAWVKMAVTALLIGIDRRDWQYDTEKDVIKKWIGEVQKDENGQDVTSGQLNYHLKNSLKQRKKIRIQNFSNGLVLCFTFIIYAVLFVSELTGCFNLDKSIIGVFDLRMLLKSLFSVCTAITFAVSYYYSKLSLNQNERDSIHMVRLFQTALDRINMIDRIYPVNDEERKEERKEEMKSLVVELARNQLVENGTWVAYNRDNGNDMPI